MGERRNSLALLFILATATACPDFDRQARPNAVPTAFAGADQVVRGGEQVTLSGQGEDTDEGDVLSYAWAQVGGAPVELSATDAPEVTFVAPESAQTLVFGLTVSDGFDESLQSLVQVTVRFNRAPIADAGPPVSTPNGASVTLDGSGSSDPDGDRLAYSWRVDAGPAASSLTGLLTGEATPYPTFTPDAKGTFTLALSVDDGEAQDEVFVTAEATNNGPEAVTGGAQDVLNARELQVTATATDPDGDAVTEWSWTVLQAPPGADHQLVDETTATVGFTPLGKGRWTLGVQAGDGESLGPVATVSVRALNNAPVVDAIAPITAPNLSDIGLLATATDADGDLLTWAWTVTAAPGGASHQLLGAASASPTFRPGGKGEWTLTATASDEAASGSGTVTITASNNPPTAAVAQSSLVGLTAGASVLLDGSASTDPDGDALVYRWTQVSGPAVTIADNQTETAVRTGVVFPALGTYGLTLAVSDDGGVGWSSEVSLTAQVTNLRPVAAATALPVAPGGAVLSLDGTGSSDPEGATLTYSWSQTGGPAVTIVNAASSVASVDIPTVSVFALPSALTFELVVSDGVASSAPASVTVAIAPSEADAEFVSPTGDNGNPGTLALPKSSLTGASAEAASFNPRKLVVMAGGTYGGLQTMANGVHVVGGFSPDFGDRDVALYPSVIAPSGTDVALTATNLSEQTIIDGLVILGPSAYTSGSGTGIAMSMTDSNLVIRNSVIDGNGAQGTDGAALWIPSTTRPLLIQSSYIRNTRAQDVPVGLRIFSGNVTTPIIIEDSVFEMDSGAINSDGDTNYSLVLLSVGSVSSLIVRRNVFRMVGGAPNTNLACTAIGINSSGLLLENNLFDIRAGCAGVAAVSMAGMTPTVQFNTFVRVDPGLTGITTTALTASGNPTGYVALNNVATGWDRFVNQGTFGQEHELHGNVVEAGTVFFLRGPDTCITAAADGTCTDSCGLGGDESECWETSDLTTVFADAGAGDYRPATGGVLVDRGFSDPVSFPFVVAPTDDHDGDPRPVDDPATTDTGTTYDIGAYEWRP